MELLPELRCKNGRGGEIKMRNVTAEEFLKNIDEYLSQLEESDEMILIIDTGKTKLALQKEATVIKVRNKALDMGFQLGLSQAAKSIEDIPYEGKEPPHAGILCSDFDPETGTFDDIIEVTAEQL